jgi:hypothetical protein
MALLTLLDVAKRNGSDMLVGLLDETTKSHPEVTGKTAIAGREVTIPNVAASRTIKGTHYKTLVRITLPTVGFRNANEGTTETKSTYENRLVETFILNPRWGADKAVADRSEDGAEAMIADEADAHTSAAWDTVGKQFYYGPDSGGDTKGFPGLIDVYDSTNNVVDAGGTTGATGSSVWLVKWGPKFVQWCVGANGDFELSDVELRDKLDANNKPYTAYHQELLGYPGLQVGTLTSLVRIKKLTEDNGKGLTDALIAKALEKFPVGVVPDVMFMTRRSHRQLRDSRTATNPTGAPAPFPEESYGIPIAPTDSILNTEALTL